MGWHSNGALTNPVAGDILADTGPLLVGISTISVLVDTTVAGYVELVHRNALNTTDLHTQPIWVDSGNKSPLGAQMGMTMLVNERFLLRALTSMLGTIKASILL